MFKLDKKYLYKLEYNKVLDILSKYAKTYIGKDMCSNLMPSPNKDEVNTLLSQTNEAIRLYNIKGSIPIYPFLDTSIWIKSLESYVSLSAKALLEVGKILKMSRQLKEYFSSLDNTANYSNLEYLFSDIYINPNIENNIFKSIIDENNIADNASQNLSSIRRKRKSLEQNIKTKLNSFIHSSANSKYIQEPIITIKNDRFVVPIKGEYRSMVKGFIHDISSSGATVFIEPLSIFEINNEINALKLEENVEIQKILLELSKSLFPLTLELSKNIDIISNLDFIFAKAMYSIDLDGICPILNNENHINLVKARHPLIDKEVVVPIDLSIRKRLSNFSNNWSKYRWKNRNIKNCRATYFNGFIWN